MLVGIGPFCISCDAFQGRRDYLFPGMSFAQFILLSYESRMHLIDDGAPTRIQKRAPPASL